MTPSVLAFAPSPTFDPTLGGELLAPESEGPETFAAELGRAVSARTPVEIEEEVSVEAPSIGSVDALDGEGTDELAISDGFDTEIALVVALDVQAVTEATMADVDLSAALTTDFAAASTSDEVTVDLAPETVNSDGVEVGSELPVTTVAPGLVSDVGSVLAIEADVQVTLAIDESEGIVTPPSPIEVDVAAETPGTEGPQAPAPTGDTAESVGNDTPDADMAGGVVETTNVDQDGEAATGGGNNHEAAGSGEARPADVGVDSGSDIPMTARGAPVTGPETSAVTSSSAVPNVAPVASVVSSEQTATLATRASMDRVLAALDVISKQPPPRVLTLDFTELHGVRVTLSLDEGSVNVTVADSGAGDSRAQQWQEQLHQMLGDRRSSTGSDQTEADDNSIPTGTGRATGQPDRSNELRL